MVSIDEIYRKSGNSLRELIESQSKETTLCIETNQIHSIFYAVMLTSVFFMILTFIVYISISELRNNFHGKCFLCYLVCLATSFTFLACLISDKWNNLALPILISMTYIVYPSIISTSLWLNVISIDLWLSFRLDILLLRTFRSSD